MRTRLQGRETRWWRPLTAFLVVALSLLLLGTLGISVASAAGIRPRPDKGGWRVQGEVYATAIVKDVVYVAGSFSGVASPQGRVWPRDNLAAFHLRSGTPVRGWKPNPDGVVKALTVSGTALYVGGEFHTIGGVTQPHLARVIRATGAVDPRFAPVLRSPARAVRAWGRSLYVGGFFDAVNGQPAHGLAKLNARTGALDTGFSASLNGGGAYALLVDRKHNRLYVGGLFTRVNNRIRRGVAQLNGTTGRTTSRIFRKSVSPTLSLAMGAGRLYGAQGGDANALMAWRLSNGQRAWRIQAGGDVQAVAYRGRQVWFGFHAGYRHNTSLKALQANALTGRVSPAFHPTIKAYWGVRSISVGAEGLVLGGDFNRVSGVVTGHMARFLRR